MKVAITMPKLGLTMTEGTVGEWLKKEGERVTKGEPVLEVMTEKITNVVEAPAAGILAEILVGTGEVVPVGAELGYIVVEEESGGAEGTSVSPEDGDTPAPDEGRPLSPMRETISRRMQESWGVPQVTIFAEADVTALNAAYRERKAQLPGLTFTTVLLRGLAVVLKEMPVFRSYIREGKVYTSDRINIGVAVAVPGGLVVPVIADVDRLSLAQLNEAVQQVVARAREGRLTEADLSGGVFTLSNLGAYRITHFTPILNLPEAAILGVGRLRETVVWKDGQPAPREVLPLSLTHDHRLLDGKDGAEFLQRLEDLLEAPETLLED